jgi:CBS domain-containing protein
MSRTLSQSLMGGGFGRRHLPVVEGERWVGMLSMRDLLRVEINEQGDELKLLHEYISH